MLTGLYGSSPRKSELLQGPMNVSVLTFQFIGEKAEAQRGQVTYS